MRQWLWEVLLRLLAVILQVKSESYVRWFEHEGVPYIFRLERRLCDLKKDWQKVDIAHKLLRVLADENVSNIEADEIIELLVRLKKDTVLSYEFPKPEVLVGMPGNCDTSSSSMSIEEVARR